jgi:hypothetical protein
MNRTEIDEGVFVDLVKNIKTGLFTGMLVFKTPNIKGRTFIQTRQKSITVDTIVKSGKLIYQHYYIRTIVDILI